VAALGADQVEALSTAAFGKLGSAQVARCPPPPWRC